MAQFDGVMAPFARTMASRVGYGIDTAGKPILDSHAIHFAQGSSI
ncbi:hypothetical protein ACET9Q_11680 [Aeromonas caviae]|jgi:hypothetical protein|uniref:Uncharacterized protein n=1 Tax=Aeromonas caviae TaxID=648 RepID=A0ABU5WDX6_AERCA|nr:MULTISPECIES: hypothetical protein [Aeromonas]MCR3930538.1 hypothetical protein [Aeromonas caviae]MCX4031307.1 hypothetical protein [Aeromonas caviae]MCX4070725.1 hypothetical protein [Aeromonas caviae]MDH0351967.1 hypothetical protein [Aeromonas caviae]MDH0475620.1 hypothetical protein [Aeromonas caviae]